MSFETIFHVQVLDVIGHENGVYNKFLIICL